MREETRLGIDQLSFEQFREIMPALPGLYFVYVMRPGALAETPLEDVGGGLLYVGKAQDSLHARVVGMHFRDGATGRSSLRRTLGAALMNTLGLRPRPRQITAGKARSSHFLFDDAGESRLSAWMRDNLLLAWENCEYPDQLRTREKVAIAELQPPLNLTGWENPHRKGIMELRRRCAEMAEREVQG